MRFMICLCAVWFATLSMGAQRGSTVRSTLDQFLTTRFGLRAAQLAALKRGEPVAVQLSGSVDREIVVGGAVRIQAPVERTVALVRDIERLESGPSFLHTRRLSEPPRLDDFAGFEVTPDDLAALRRCRPGKCDVNLGQKAFDELARIDWSRPDAAGHVSALARQSALEYVEAYRQGGNEALAVYTDRERPLSVAQEFADMVRRTSQLPDVMPELADHLLGHPTAPRPKDAEDFYYWSVADFGLKPVFRLNYVVIHRPQSPIATRYAIATKQLYANHYFHTALEVRSLIDDDAQPGIAHYLVVLNMARLDGLTGLFGGLVKSRVRAASRSGLERSLLATKRLAERTSAQ